jgi:hypothetical protein
MGFVDRTLAYLSREVVRRIEIPLLDSETENTHCIVQSLSCRLLLNDLRTGRANKRSLRSAIRLEALHVYSCHVAVFPAHACRGATECLR